ncbi:hypothetical protein FB45DRAFT_28166 [Roridomyces roridus]|uniref:Methyltransferase domain-containing protein n=1 Tax=Roridomyces roridus TaxID=1738132 RepID=A0AAD7CK62_9AGAR|nr:hypothetical protein FB45DRAFT_28166 [Roridomyces roridus]
MSSRAASGRKKLVPKAALPQHVSPNSITQTRDSDLAQSQSPAYHAPWRTIPSPAPSSATSSTSSFPDDITPRSPAARDMYRAPQGGITPYTIPPQTPFYEPPPRRREKAVSNSNSASRYTSPPITHAERNDSRHRPPPSRSLPPYPSPPPSHTGWAALSDSKVAAATAVPPSYPDNFHHSFASNMYPSPPLQSHLVQPDFASVASSSRVSPAPERPQTPRFAPEPPYYTPPSSPPHSVSRLPIGSISSAPRTAHSYSPEALAYPSSRSSDALPSPSFASLSTNRYGRPNQLPTPAGSSGSSLTSTAAGMQSTQSISSSSSSSSSEPPPASPTHSPAANTAAGGFVFPSSRSVARPGATRGFRLRGNRKLKDKMRAQEQDGQVQEEPRTLPPPPRQVPLPTSIPPPNPSAAPQPFYFPSARTRAHPKSATQITFKGKKKEGEGGTGRFLRLGILRRKIVVVDATSGVPVSPHSSRSSIERSSPTSSIKQRGSSDSQRPRQNQTPPPTPPTPQIVTKVGTYPLDAYDAGLIENDRNTWELLNVLNRSPSFHNYSTRPPHYVLDLGCGAGHWALDAAVAWRDGGTQIIGFDMVDTTKALWGQRRMHNVKFVKGNFMKKPLPFPDEYFDLVRIANLTLCVPYDKWEFLLQQAHRVLAVGGRLEFIDDQVFFPYGKPPLLAPTSPEQQNMGQPPHLDMTIPYTGFSRMSLTDVINAGGREDTDSEIYNLYDVEEDEGENSDTDTVASAGRRHRLETPTPWGHRPAGNRPADQQSLASVDPEVWHEQVASAQELESLFESMIELKFGIHLRPAEFIYGLLKKVFGPSAKEIAQMHVTLAPPEGRDPSPPAGSDALDQCPGLILWPSTFIPMTLPELEVHVSKHQRVLLSCKAALVDYAAEVAGRDDGETQGQEAMEALWEYQNFMRERFNPPPEEHAHSVSSEDGNSIRNSIFSASSVGTEALEAMRDYESDLIPRFEWAEGEGAQNTPPRGSIIEFPRPPSHSAPAVVHSPSGAPPQTRRRGSVGRDGASLASTVAPPYSRIELTHVRTFFVYEAIKVGEGRGR